MRAWPIYVYAPLPSKTKQLPQGPRQPVGQTPVWQTWAWNSDRWYSGPGLVFFRRRPRLAVGFANAGVRALPKAAF